MRKRTTVDHSASHSMTPDNPDNPDETQLALDAPARGSAALIATGPPLPGRYDDLGPIGSGAFGEVRRVRDTLLGRVVAMKLLRASHADRDQLRRRFLVEAQITAQLQHPGIVAVYDRGELADGRLWFTMKEVRGRTLGDAIDELHAHKGPAEFVPAPSGWTFRRLIDAFARIVQAIAYAHSRGIVHRDLKPDNLMVGEFGEVLVMDWGLAHRLATAGSEPDGTGGASGSSPSLTHHGDVLGTPAYMSPEQARGDTARHGPASDIYALGAVLHCLLTGEPPYRGSAAEVIASLISGPPVQVGDAAAGGPPLPIELVAVCERAMRREIAERYETADALAADVVAWLDGVRRRDHALAVLERARLLDPEIAALSARASGAHQAARALRGQIRSFDPIEHKRPMWSLEDEAAQLRRAAALAETRWTEAVHGALNLDPDLPEAHALLADHHRRQLVEAERSRRDDDAARAEAMLRIHDRGRHAGFLRGEGALTLVTDPPGAEVWVDRYVMRDRRLVPVPEGALGVTPLIERRLPRGSYLLRLRAPGRAEVRYPVLIERAGHWDGRAPGESEPRPIALPADGEIGPDDCYVPSGWCWTGGDPGAAECLAISRLWVDGFVIRRFPVRNAEYLEFLNQLVASGREAEALAACPRPQTTMPQAADELVFRRDADGRFGLTAVPGDSAGQPWQPSWPVVLVDWHSSNAYARWLAGRTGHAWRLPNELEREKAARGADGRHYPWGDHFDATWACVLDSYPGDASRVGVERYPLDESACGARGLAGNVRDWCENAWTHDGPPTAAGRLRIAVASSDDALRAIRGGAWGSPGELSRAEARFASRPQARWKSTGLRLARSLG
jgi:serine/threonine-protein kinase